MSGNGVMPAAVDRGRVAERLRAAFAGLQELHHLREKQDALVQRALLTDTDTKTENPCSEVCLPQSDEDTNRAEEQQRLEATLTALKVQLLRLRRQDVGLKTHLQHLDQQISELKLDACKASAEHLESDSRPSSGFFELSDGGLGSLSNSCTSVYSECLSTSSQASLHPLSPGFSAVHNQNAQLQAEVSRRRSADETTAQTDIPRGLGVRLGSSGIRTGSISLEKARQRPVSTGDLDRVMNPGFGYYKPADVNTSILSSKFCNPTVDPKYQNNLISRNGTEVYSYPSPLHAVALQSPIFSLAGDKGGPFATDALERHIKLGISKDTLTKQELNIPKPEGYIVKLLQRSTSKMSLQSEMCVEKRQNQSIVPQDHRHLGSRIKILNVDELQGSLQRKTSEESIEKLRNNGNKSPLRSSDKEQTNLNGIRAEEYRQMCHVQSSVNTRNQNPAALMGQEKVDDNQPRDQFDPRNGSEETSTVVKAPERMPSFFLPLEESKIKKDGDFNYAAKSEFVCAQFVPAGSQRVKVRQADKKTKAVKLRKRGHEKPSKKHLLKHSSREHEKGYSTKTREDKNPKQINAEREWNDEHLIEPRLRSCSDSSLLGPRNTCGTCLRSCQLPKHTSKSNKLPKAHLPGLENLSYKKQSSQKWLHAPEMQLPLTPLTHYQKSKEMPFHRIPQKPGMVRSVSMRPRSGHWGGLPHTVQPSMQPTSHFCNLNLKYPPAPRSSCYPPRCESEYSAECASLFHSTIVESSEGELSDYTTNRFGDSESSQESQTASDSDSSLSLDEDNLYEEDEDERGLVWAEATMGPTTNGLSVQQHLQTESASCRIKASRALKKKIRRFQPASLKVMTLV